MQSHNCLYVHFPDSMATITRTKLHCKTCDICGVELPPDEEFSASCSPAVAARWLNALDAEFFPRPHLQGVESYTEECPHIEEISLDLCRECIEALILLEHGEQQNELQFEHDRVLKEQENNREW